MKNQFAASVPNQVQTNMETLAQYVKENLNKYAPNAEFVSETQIDVIEGNHVSGWVPFQRGGYVISSFIRNDSDTSYHLTENQTKNIQKHEKNCFADFLDENGFDGDVSFDDLSDEEKEDYFNYEREWFSEIDMALFSVEIYVDQNTDNIVFKKTVNYNDAPYYRQEYAEVITKATFSFEQFNDMVKLHYF